MSWLLRTIAYIDGFNLYFGSLKNTPYKWLDPYLLASRLCKEQNPESEILSVKYFTSDIQAKLSRKGQVSCKTQQEYLHALQAYSPDVKIIKGKYFIGRSSFHLYGEPVDFDKKYAVWRAEEKQTDTNIVLNMVYDAMDRECEQNDSIF